MLRSPTIEAYDIMTIVSRTWYKSFDRINSNKKAIAERGWFPYNRNLCNTSTQIINYQYVSKQEARSRIKKIRDKGKTLGEKLREMKRFTAGKLFNANSCRVGHTMLHVHK